MGGGGESKDGILGWNKGRREEREREREASEGGGSGGSGEGVWLRFSFSGGVLLLGSILFGLRMLCYLLPTTTGFGLLTVKKKEEKKKLSFSMCVWFGLFCCRVIITFFRVFCIFNCNVAVVFMLTQCGIHQPFFFSSSHSFSNLVFSLNTLLTASFPFSNIFFLFNWRCSMNLFINSM
ncbi:hypothetical protein MtrunA17_Chr1g0195441 [Medicago truncatula]|uniref:Transmembrane protein n=1 Tax=Medicago truncatula TaxID=3880 RepID=A0A396JS27_MEDTR|nr:hypothetical protein MtrunA17_Chr1g0195441 [Medicago truncatula]